MSVLRSALVFAAALLLVLADADGSGTLRVTGGVGSGFAGWSTYGTHLAHSNSGSFQPGDTVFVAAADGTGPRDITGSLAGPVNSAASWRPQPPGPTGLFDPSPGQWHLDNGWGFVTSFYYGDPGDYPFMGDWNCDGIDTPGLYRQSDGFVYLRNSNTQGVADIRFFFGDPGGRLVAGDWGIINGVDTPGVFRPANATFYYRHTNTQGVADSQATWGRSDWLPISGSFGLK